MTVPTLTGQTFRNGETFIATSDDVTPDGQTVLAGQRVIAWGPRDTDLSAAEVRWAVSDPVTTGATIIGTGPPPADVAAQFEASVGRVVSFVDIYEQDGTTLFAERVGYKEGTVSVDFDRPERRNLDIILDDGDGALGYGPGEFWYDKVIRPHRGITIDTGDDYVFPLGSFIPDNIERPRFPARTMSVTCRDLSAQLDLDGFAEVTTFAAGLNVADVIETIAINGGVSNFNFQAFDDELDSDVTFEQGSSRLNACISLAESIGAEVFFDAYSNFVLRPFVDPLTAPVDHTFRTGITGNLVDYSRKSSATYMKNDIVVQGSSQANALVFGRATNTNPASPTRVSEIGRRIRIVENAFVADNTAANAIAAAILSVSGLEQFDLDMRSITIPWLEAGNAVESILPDSSVVDPTRFLLSSFQIPLGPGAMDARAKRVTIVG